MPCPHGPGYTEWMRKIPTLLLATLLLTPAAFADLDKDSEEALRETEAMMNNPALRAAAIKGDPDGTKASLNLKAATGGDPQKEADAYKLGMEVFSKIVQEEGGDLDRIQKRLQDYQANPNSLGGMMSEAQKAELRRIASEKKK